MTKDTITIRIDGEPMGKPRMTQRDKWKQRPSVMRYRAWCDLARASFMQAGVPIPDANSIERLDWIAHFEPPKSWSKKKRAAMIGQLHRQRPDRDNIDKAVCDALFKEDSGIALGTIEKRWGETSKLELSITVTAEKDQPDGE